MKMSEFEFKEKLHSCIDDGMLFKDYYLEAIKYVDMVPFLSDREVSDIISYVWDEVRRF